MKKLLLIDAFNFLHRAYHALPKTFKGRNGEPINAVYGVASMLINLFGQLRPNYVVAAFDSEAPTLRVTDFTAYKAHRKPLEEDLAVQIPKVREVLEAFGIKIVEVPGYEADDIIGTLVKRYEDECDVYLVSNDRDLWQLASANVFIMLPSAKTKLFDLLSSREVETRLGFSADKISDYKGLRGDPSDNIPGVYGIGEKGAQTLVKEFGSIENVYAHIDQVQPVSLKEKLLNGYEQALMSKKLATIIRDAPVTVGLDECVYSEFNYSRVKAVLEKYNFKSLIKRLGFDVGGPKGKGKSSKESASGAGGEYLSEAQLKLL